MNPRDFLVELQAVLEQVLRNTQPLQYAVVALGLAAFILMGIVVYLFYARLRDIAHELKLFRIYYKSAHPLGQEGSSPMEEY